MNSKIIKISILIIVMLFFAGLFNSVFALGAENFDVYKTIEYHEGVYNGLGRLLFSNADFEFNRISCDNIYADSSNKVSISIFNLFKKNDEYANITIDNFENAVKFYCYSDNASKLYCFVLGDGYDSYCFEDGILRDFDSSGLKKISSMQYYFEYNFDDGAWYGIGNFNGIRDGDWYIVGYEGNLKIYDSPDISNLELLFESDDFVKAKIDLITVRTGTKSGYVEFIPKNWNSPHMYYIKDDKDELERLISEEELSVIHPKVKYYYGPVDIEAGEFVMGILFDNDGNIVFNKISEALDVNYDVLYDKSHKLYLDKNDEDTYYLSIHSYQEGDYVEVSTYQKDDDSYSNHMKVLDFDGFEYNGLQIGALFENNFGHKVRKIKLSKNGITYFNLYDKDGNFINTCVLNSSNYYSGEDFDFDVDLSYGSSRGINALSSSEIRWVKVKPIIKVPSLSNYELYIRISDYGTLAYIDEEDRIIYATHDSSSNDYIGIDLSSSSNGLYRRIDDKFQDYFYLCTGTNDSNFTFELQLRSKSGQVIQTKSFNVNTSAKSGLSGTISSATDGKNDTYVRDPSELANGSLNSNNFNFDGLNSATDLNSLKNNLSGMLDNSIGFFSLISTFLLLLPTWVSSLIYFFLFGIIVITLYRFVRGA